MSFTYKISFKDFYLIRIINPIFAAALTKLYLSLFLETISSQKESIIGEFQSLIVFEPVWATVRRGDRQLLA